MAVCAAKLCEAEVKPSMLMCKRHWFMVPKRIRDRVWRAWRGLRSDRPHSQAEYDQAVLEAVQAVSKEEGITA